VPDTAGVGPGAGPVPGLNSYPKSAPVPDLGAGDRPTPVHRMRHAASKTAGSDRMAADSVVSRCSMAIVIASRFSVAVRPFRGYARAPYLRKTCAA
jgi:hypothetical protein